MASTTKSPTVVRKPAAAKAAPAGAKKPASAATNAAGQRQASPQAGKFFRGAFIYIIVTEVLLLGVSWVNAKFNLHMEKPFFSIGPFPISAEFLWLIVLAVVVLWILSRFNILPRNSLMSPTAQAMTRSSSATKSAPAKPTAATSAAPVLSRLFRRPAPASTAAAPAKSEAPKRATTSTANDAIYERVRAHQQATARKRRKH
jgi:hypothetical protein